MNTRVGGHALFQKIFPIQGLNPGLLQSRQILYCLSHQGSPRVLKWVVYPLSRGSSWLGIELVSLVLLADSLPTELPGKPYQKTHIQNTNFLRLFHYIITVHLSRSVLSHYLRPPWIAARQASLSITNSRGSLKLTLIESVMPSSHLILCRALFLLPPIPPSLRVFSNESALYMRWPKYWRFSLSISLSNEHLNMNLGWTGWISLQSKGLSRVFSSTTVQKHQFLAFSFLLSPTLTSIRDHWKNDSLDNTDLCWQSNVSAFQYAI